MSPSSQPVHVNSATLIVGPTKSGKTALIATAAEYLWDLHRKVLLLASTDGGGIPSKVQALMRQGVIRYWKMRTRGEAYETCLQASKGWFPSRIKPSTGETKPGVRLVPPITERYVMHCPEGHVVKTVSVQALLTPAVCPTCKKPVDRTTMKVTRSAYLTKGFEDVGGMAFDGLSSMQSWMMNDMGARRGRMELRGGEGEKGVTRIQSGDLAVGGTTGTDYGFVQTRAEEMVLNSLGIPNMVIPPIWTALLLETTDEGGLPVKGPKLAGKAKTDEAPAWFGNALEIGIVKDEEGHDVRRLSLTEFVDDSGIRHLIGHRGSPNMPPYLQDEYGKPWGQANLGVFFDLLDKDIAETIKESEAKYADAPGVPEGEVSYGEEPAAATPAPAAPVATRPAARGPVGRRPAAKPAVAPAPVEAAPADAGPAEETPASPETPSVEAAVSSAADSDDVSAPEPESPTEDAAAAPVPVRPAPRPAPRPAAVAPRAANAKPYAPPPAPRPPASAPRVPGLLPRKS